MIFNQKISEVNADKPDPASSPYFEGEARLSFTYGQRQNRPSHDSGNNLQVQYPSF